MRIGTPLTGLVASDVPRAPSKWDKYDLLHDALKASADSQPVCYSMPSPPAKSWALIRGMQGLCQAASCVYASVCIARFRPMPLDAEKLPAHKKVTVSVALRCRHGTYCRYGGSHTWRVVFG